LGQYSESVVGVHRALLGLVLGNQPAISARFRARLSGAKFTLFSRLCTAGRATDSKYVFSDVLFFHHGAKIISRSREWGMVNFEHVKEKAMLGNRSGIGTLAITRLGPRLAAGAFFEFVWSILNRFMKSHNGTMPLSICKQQHSTLRQLRDGNYKAKTLQDAAYADSLGPSSRWFSSGFAQFDPIAPSVKRILDIRRLIPMSAVRVILWTVAMAYTGFILANQGLMRCVTLTGHGLTRSGRESWCRRG
jgi:hypothetical protein